MKIAKLVSRNVRPSFKHDCKSCRFLGKLDNRDLYVCNLDYGYIVRNSDRPEDYGSLGDLTPEGSAYSLASKLKSLSMPNAYRTA